MNNRRRERDRIVGCVKRILLQLNTPSFHTNKPKCERLTRLQRVDGERRRHYEHSIRKKKKRRTMGAKEE
jgi:hypothetical protein